MRRLQASAAKHILVVEDDADTRESTVELLEMQGNLVSSAQHGAEALSLLRNGLLPDLIVLDLEMPVMDGWQLLEELQFQIWEATPKLVLSASLTGEKVPSGADACLPKPAAPSTLLATVRELAERSQRRRNQKQPMPEVLSAAVG